jgi:hypothetical protein
VGQRHEKAASDVIFPQTFILDTEPKRQRLLAFLKVIEIKQPLHILIDVFRKDRSIQQNKRYWLLMDRIAMETGHEKDEIHEFCKEKFLGTRVIEIAGERANVSPSTRRLTVQEFRDYSEKVEQFMIETLGVWLD